jgi:hypothetical protein
LEFLWDQESGAVSDMDTGIRHRGIQLGKMKLSKASMTKMGNGRSGSFDSDNAQPGLTWARLLRSFDTPMGKGESGTVDPMELAALYPSAPDEHDLLTAS